MYIKRLNIKSFRSYANVEFPLDSSRVLLGGVNESGKTSARESLRWLLTGKARSHDGSPLAVEDLVPTGGPDGVAVDAVMDPLGTVTRYWTPTGSELQVQGFQGTPNGQQIALFDKLGTTEAFIHAILDTAVFLRLSHVEAKKLVLDLLNVSVTVDGTAYTLDGLEAAYKAAFEDRRIQKAKLKTMTVPAAVAGEFPPIPAIQERLVTLRTELEDLNQQVGKTAGRRHQIQQQITAIPVSRADILWPLKTMPADESNQLELEAKVADLEERLAIMEADASGDPVDEPAPLPSNKPTHDVTVLRSRAEALLAHKPTKGCVLDAKIDCPVHGLKFKNRARDIQAEIDAAGDGSPASSGLVVQPPRQPNPMTALRKELDRLKALQVGYVRAAEQNAERQSERDRLQAELSQLPDISAQETEMAAKRQSIQKGEGILKDAQMAQKALAERQTAEKALEGQKQEVARLEALCEVLGPSGARVQALQAAMDPFLEAVNGFTGAFGWQVSIVAEPWQVTVNGRRVETYSRSSQYRIGIALQIAIAKLSGLGLIVVDELDVMDAKNREMVGKMLFASELTQVIILGTREPSSPLPNVKGMAAFRIGQVDGRSQILETSGS